MRSKDDRVKIRSGERGFLLLEAMVAAGLMGVLWGIIGVHSQRALKATTRVEQLSDKGELRVYIASAVSCRKTEAAGCGGSIALKRTTVAGEKNLFPGNNGSPDGPDGSYRFGRFYVRTTCDSSGESLLIKAIPTYEKGPVLGGKKLTFADSESDLFGGSSGLPLCYNLNIIGTSTQASIDHFTDWVTRSTPLDATLGAADGNDLAALGLNDIEFGGISCNKNKGYKLTGCYNNHLSSDNPQGDDAFTYAINQSCFARKQRKIGKKNGYVKSILTAICLKAE